MKRLGLLHVPLGFYKSRCIYTYVPINRSSYPLIYRLLSTFKSGVWIVSRSYAHILELLNTPSTFTIYKGIQRVVHRWSVPLCADVLSLDAKWASGGVSGDFSGIDVVLLSSINNVTPTSFQSFHSPLIPFKSPVTFASTKTPAIHTSDSASSSASASDANILLSSVITSDLLYFSNLDFNKLHRRAQMTMAISIPFYLLLPPALHQLDILFSAPIPFESLTPLVSLPILYAISKWVLYRRCLASTLLIRNLYGSIGLVPVDKTVNDRATQVLDGIDVAVSECVSKSQKDHTKVHWVPIKPLCALARLNHLRIPDFVKSVTRARQKHQRRMLIELD